jgi:hypothetical protein
MVRTLALCALLAHACGAAAAGLEIPLRVSLDTLREAFNAQLTGYQDGPCRRLSLKPAALESRDGHLQLALPGNAAVGVELAGKCRTAATWQGVVHFKLVPRLDEAGRMRVQIVDSKASGMAPAMWSVIKRQLHPRLERFSYDLGASREALAGLLRDAAPPAYHAAMDQALQRVQVLPPRVEASHVLVPIALDVPEKWLAAVPVSAAAGASAPLTEAELEALEKALEPWDAFLVAVVRQIATDGENEALRRRLFTLLLDSRYRLSAMLAGDEPVVHADPLRILLLETWGELRAILIEAQQAGTLPPSLLRYALFIDAADALVALENAAPGLPLSADGLRQLARNLKPGEGDPLAYDWSVDRDLSRLFQVEEISPVEPSPAPTSWLDFFISRAHADHPLDRWVPTRQELASYEARVGDLLQKTAATELQRGSVLAPYDRVYRHLVPTTALIESCWKQYVVKNGKVTYLRSQSSSVGIMQINQRVWRGFYDIERVRWDTAYNARAGAQILMRYLKDYAIPYAQKTGQPEDVARAAYAVYNAGPRAVGRFDKQPPHPREARVDEKLLTLYRAVAGGAQVDLANCGVATPGKSSAARAQ